MDVNELHLDQVHTYSYMSGVISLTVAYIVYKLIKYLWGLEKKREWRKKIRLSMSSEHKSSLDESHHHHHHHHHHETISNKGDNIESLQMTSGEGNPDSPPQSTKKRHRRTSSRQFIGGLSTSTHYYVDDENGLPPDAHGGNDTSIEDSSGSIGTDDIYYMSSGTSVSSNESNQSGSGSSSSGSSSGVNIKKSNDSFNKHQNVIEQGLMSPRSKEEFMKRVKATMIDRRQNILNQPMLEQLSKIEENQPRPRRIVIGKPSLHSLTSASNNLFNKNQQQQQQQKQLGFVTNSAGTKFPTIISAIVNPSLYVPTNTYGYYKEEGSTKIEIDKPKKPITKSNGINQNNNDILQLQSFIESQNTNNNNTNQNNNNNTNTVHFNETITKEDNSSNRKKLMSSNYSQDSGFQVPIIPNIKLRSANDRIVTSTGENTNNTDNNQANSNNNNNSKPIEFNNDDDGDDEMEEEPVSKENLDEVDDLDDLYNLNSSRNSILTSSISGMSTIKTTSSNPPPSTTTNSTTTTTATLNPSTVPLQDSNTSIQFAISNDSVKTNKSLEEDEEEDYCGSDVDGEDFSSAKMDYNERFQEIMDDLRNQDCNSIQIDKIRVNSQFIAITQDFVYNAQTFGRVIISERYLPNHEKTIPSIDIGGLAGGDKFIVHGILFKFAIDKENFYGSDYAASCVAGHELKGLINVFNSGIKDLSLPLMALVDYRGFRVIAMSILPVDKDTICYGSNDYGMTIHNSDKYLSDRLQDVAQLLNIKSHHCGESGTYVHSPADLEGHNGFDGRYYLLDFARLFPPEAPSRSIKMGHLYRLLRPEFVRNYKTSLCSDSFSRFIKGHNDEEHNRETVEATEYLYNTTIPELAEELDGEHLDINNIYDFPLTAKLHKSGVNIRYLGHVRQLITSPDMKSLIFVEMCARVAKQQIRQKLRFKMKQAKIPLEAPYRRLIVAYLNRVLSAGDKTDIFWNEKMKKKLSLKFDKGLFDFEINGDSLIHGLSDFSDEQIDGKYLLFKRIQKMTGLKFTTRVNDEFRSKPNCWLERGDQPLDINDLEEIGIRVKYVPFMNIAQGYLFKVKGEILFGQDPMAANRFFLMALEKLENAIETDPNNPNTLCTIGEVYSHLGEGSSQSLATLAFSLTNPYVEKATEYFQRAIFMNRNHTTSLFRMAQLLERLGEYDRAEEYYLKSLESNPNNIACLQEYGNFLQEVKKDSKTAEQFYVRVSENHHYLHISKSQKQTDISLRSSSGLLKYKPKDSSMSGSGSGYHSSNSSGSSISNSSSTNNNTNRNSNNNISFLKIPTSQNNLIPSPISSAPKSQSLHSILKTPQQTQFSSNSSPLPSPTSSPIGPRLILSQPSLRIGVDHSPPTSPRLKFALP